MIRMVLASFLLIVCLLGVSTKASAQQRVALVIGNSAYKYTTPLPNPRNDAEKIITILERLGFTVVGGVDLDRQNFEKAVRNFSKKLRTADVGLFFYAGHGLQVNGRNYLVPVDARLKDESDLDFAMVELRKVMRQMEHNSKTNLVFIDACRDNPLARNLARAMGLSRSTAIGRGMAPTRATIGTMITYATQPDNVALDGKGKNSPFTAALAKHIETPGLDIAHMLRRVRRQVIKATNGHQVPWNHSSLTHGFVFKSLPATKNPNQSADTKPTPSTPTPQPTKDRLLAAYQATRKMNSCGGYRAFKKNYSHGFFAQLATDWVSRNCGKDSGNARGDSGDTNAKVPRKKSVSRSKANARFPFDGTWFGKQCLNRFRHLKAGCYPRVATIKKGRLRSSWGSRNQAPSGTIIGRIKSNGSFVLTIKGRSAFGRRFTGKLRGKINNNRLSAAGKYRTGRRARLNLGRRTP